MEFGPGICGIKRLETLGAGRGAAQVPSSLLRPDGQPGAGALSHLQRTGGQGTVVLRGRVLTERMGQPRLAWPRALEWSRVSLGVELPAEGAGTALVLEARAVTSGVQ